MATWKPPTLTHYNHNSKGEQQMLLRDRKQSGKLNGEASSSSTGPRNSINKPQSIWERVREEHHETIDQLALTLIRQMALLQEIDRRSNALSSQILPELQAYMVNRSTVGGNGVHNPSSQSRRESLSNLVKLSEDGLKASEEKVYLAQAAQDTVERHIRILDQAILELEIMISSDNLLGLNPAPFTLPDLTVPRWAKPSRVADSSDDESVQDGSKRERVNIDGDKVLRKKSSKRAPSHKGHSNQQSLPLKITLPGSSGLAISEEAHLDTRTYCYCNSVSFGEMIACDDPRCQREWFHLGCAGLTVPPEGKWFCQDCSIGKKRKRA